MKTVSICPSCQADLDTVPPPPSSETRSGQTLIERPAPIARTLIERTPAGPAPAEAAARKPIPRPSQQSKTDRPVSDRAVPFRPVNCPPMLKLCLLDPGSRDEGEWFRVRERRFVIGRSEGDLVLSFDDGLSSIHAELVRRTHGNGYRYVLVDLNSTNGTFVRVSKVVLRPGQELLLGNRRVVFDMGQENPSPPDAAKPHEDDTPLATISWQSQRATPATTKDSGPGLVEITPGGVEGHRLAFTRSKHIIGCDPQQADLVVTGDPFVSNVHARVVKTEGGGWRIENHNSLNGIWLRVSEMPLEQNAEFRISEQRFLVRPLN